MAAHDISVKDTLDLLDGRFATTARAVGEGQFTLWLGSGISRERVDDLRLVVQRVLAHLQERIEPGSSHCPFRKAFDSALQLALLSDLERASFDPLTPVATWPILDTILARIAKQYSILLDVTVEDKPVDYLLWDVVEVSKTFASSTATPDCEHYCVALLALEGAVGAIATANWDGLIESAAEELAPSLPDAIKACVKREDFRGAPPRTRLLKFHGCAVKASREPSVYRQLLIARQSQITGWAHDPANAVMLSQLVALASTTRTLMIGLSAQDTDIQDIFARAQAVMQWPWPDDIPANVFAEQSLGTHQQNVLRSVYRQSYAANARDIENAALFPAFAKPLLIALVLYLVNAKLTGYVSLAKAPALTRVDLEQIATGIIHLRNRIAQRADDDRLLFIRSFVRSMALGLSLFREGVSTDPASGTYRVLSGMPLHQTLSDPEFETSGLRECAVALGLLGRGDAAGLWEIDTGAAGSDGAITVATKRARTRVFFAASSDSSLRLETNGLVAVADGDVVVIHSGPYIPPQPRSPRASLGRTGSVGPRHVRCQTLLADAKSLDDLDVKFKEEAIL